MLDAIGAIISAAAFIRDVLLKKGQMIDAEIKENIVPLNDQFLRIHRGYVSMFNYLANRMRVIIGLLESGEIDDEIARQYTCAAVSEFVAARRDIEGIRDTFRHSIVAVLSICTTKEVRMYLTSLILYIVNSETEIYSKEEHIVEIEMDSLIKGGGDKINTPSVAFLLSLGAESEPKAVLAKIDQALAGLSLKESGVLSAYFKMRINHI